MFGQEFRLLPGKQITVNGRLVRGFNDNNVQIGFNRGRILFKAKNCGLQVIYDGRVYGMVQVVRGTWQNQVNGVCGTCDRNRGNDWRLRNGQMVPPRGGLYGAESIGRSWSVPSDDGRICEGLVRPPRPPPACSRAATQQAANRCSVLMKHQVVFRVCIARGIIKENFQRRYSECVMDVCALGHSSHLAKRIGCESAKTLVDRCRAGGVQIDNWRPTYNCPQPKPEPPEGLKPCDQAVDRGPCRASISSFFFDKLTGTCRPFNYGGCGGTLNRFVTYTDCLTECGGNQKPKPNDCSSIEMTVMLLQKLRLLINGLKPPQPDLSALVPITNMMKQSTAQFQVILKLFMAMRQMKATNGISPLYINFRQALASLFVVIKRGINMQYEIPDNTIIVQNKGSITNIVNSFKILNQVLTGAQKTDVFVNQFDRVHINDDVQIGNIVANLLRGNQHLEKEKLTSLKVLLPTLMMGNMEKMAVAAFKNDMKSVVQISDIQLQKIQAISQGVHMRVKVEEKIKIM